MSLDPRRYLQRGCIRDDVSGTDIDTARRTNRFDASNAVVVACVCTKHHQVRPDTADCDVHCINIIIRTERAAVCEADESCNQDNKTPSSNDHRDKVETADYLEDGSYEFSTMLQDTNLSAEEDSRKLPTSTPSRAQKTEMFQETGQTAKTMQDKSVRTEFTQDVSSETRSKTLLDLLRNNRVESQRCFCSEPYIPHGTRKIIAVNTMRRIPVCQRPSHAYAYRKINRRDIARYRKTSDVEIDDFHDFHIGKSKDEDRSFNMYNNSSGYEVFRTDEKRNNRIVQTISRSYIEDKLSRWRDPTERNLNAQDIQKEWTYVEYLIDDTLKLLGGANGLEEKRH